MSDPTRIVHSRKPKRQPKTEAPTTPPVATIVTARKRGSRRPMPETIDA